jgi:hypothetical protein
VFEKGCRLPVGSRRGLFFLAWQEHAMIGGKVERVLSPRYLKVREKEELSFFLGVFVASRFLLVLCLVWLAWASSLPCRLW